MLRFGGAAGPVTSPSPTVVNPGALEVDSVIGAESARRLRGALGRPRPGVIDKPTFAALQAFIGAPDHDGVASNQNSAAIAAHRPALRSFTVGRGSSWGVASSCTPVGRARTQSQPRSWAWINASVRLRLPSRA
ncbi:hypothetical protein Q0Z83_023000 [Actinoplanes sichuanensis]|nr:hypothetical protein Q0Z83_023000 [Actinoplanes sichuanensis]